MRLPSFCALLLPAGFPPWMARRSSASEQASSPMTDCACGASACPAYKPQVVATSMCMSRSHCPSMSQLNNGSYCWTSRSRGNRAAAPVPPVPPPKPPVPRAVSNQSQRVPRQRGHRLATNKGAALVLCTSSHIKDNTQEVLLKVTGVVHMACSMTLGSK